MIIDDLGDDIEALSVKVVCSVCGKVPKRNERQSDKTWDVYDNKPCQYCGGTLKFVSE